MKKQLMIGLMTALLLTACNFTILGENDDMAWKYENCGYAKSFNMYGIWHQTLVLEDIPSHKLNLDEKNKLIEQVIWGEIKEGKASTHEINKLDDWRINNHKALTYGNRIGEEAILEGLIEAGMSTEDMLNLHPPVNPDLTRFELAIFKDGTYNDFFTSSDTSIVFDGDKMKELIRVPSKTKI